MDRHDFTELVQELYTPVYRLALRKLSPQSADDVTAGTFEVSWRRRHDLPVAALERRMWVFGVARNLIRREVYAIGQAPTALPPAELLTTYATADAAITALASLTADTTRVHRLRVRVAAFLDGRD